MGYNIKKTHNPIKIKPIFSYANSNIVKQETEDD